jgi:hypothetical protein
MLELLGPLGPLLAAIVLVSLALGLPVVLVLLIRFLWQGQVPLGRSKELDKLVWQLHRIASSLEQERSLSFPAQQPGTAPPGVRVVAQQQQQPVAAAPVTAPAATATAATATPGAPGTEAPQHHAGVNSMFGF